jgi:Tfp pilus assembly protein PilV
MSLIEVTVAGALLAIGATAVISGWSTVNNVLQHQRRSVEATSIMRSQVERLLSLAPGDPKLAPGTSDLGTFDVFGQPKPPPQGYSVSTVIAGDTPGPGFIAMTVVVHWAERGAERETRLMTFRER